MGKIDEVVLIPGILVVANQRPLMSLRYVFKLEQEKLEILNIHYKTYSVTKTFPISLCIKQQKERIGTGVQKAAMIGFVVF
jgi:hypothetical protein